MVAILLDAGNEGGGIPDLGAIGFEDASRLIATTTANMHPLNFWQGEVGATRALRL